MIHLMLKAEIVNKKSFSSIIPRRQAGVKAQKSNWTFPVISITIP